LSDIIDSTLLIFFSSLAIVVITSINDWAIRSVCIRVDVVVLVYWSMSSLKIYCVDLGVINCNGIMVVNSGGIPQMGDAPTKLLKKTYLARVFGASLL